MRFSALLPALLTAPLLAMPSPSPAQVPPPTLLSVGTLAEGPLQQDRKAPSEFTAQALAFSGIFVPGIAGTVLLNSEAYYPGALVLLGGLTVAPSWGQFYAGSSGRALVGMAVRGTGAALFVYGLSRLSAGEACGMSYADKKDGFENGCQGTIGAGFILLPLGALALLGGSVYSLADASPAVERWHARRQRAHFTLAWHPTLERAQDGAWTAGARTHLRF